MARARMLLQIDRSRHDCLEARGPKLSFVGGIDDATRVVPWATIRGARGPRDISKLLREAVRRCGIPGGLQRPARSCAG